MSRLIYDHIIEANKLLKEYNLKLSLKDTCGGSVMQLKFLNGDSIYEDLDDKIYKIINNHFENYRLKIKYSPCKKFLFPENI